MPIIDDLKSKDHLTRDDITQLLESIGAPGKNRDEKRAAVEELTATNRQGHNIILTIESYTAY